MSGRYGWGPGHSSKTVFKGNKPVESWGVIPRTFIHELFPFSSGLSPCQAWQWLTHETAPFWISTHTHTQNPALRSLSLERQAWQKFGEFRLPSSNLVPLPLLRFVGKKSKYFYLPMQRNIQTPFILPSLSSVCSASYMFTSKWLIKTFS